MKRISFCLLLSAFLFAFAIPTGADDNDLKTQITEMQKVIDELVRQNQELSDEVEKLKSEFQPVLDIMGHEIRQKAYHAYFQERSAKDTNVYSPKELSDASSLYQLANRENSKKAISNLRKVIEKYPLSNRAGCAALYLGQRLEGRQSVNYLNLAIEKYDDCYYGDGVRVGAYARYVLGKHYESIGAKDKANEFYREIREKYPDAIDHRGELLIEYASIDK